MEFCLGVPKEVQELIEEVGYDEGADPAPRQTGATVEEAGEVASNVLGEIAAPAALARRIGWQPSADSFFDASAEMLYLLLDVPGATKETLTVQVGEGQVAIWGARRAGDLQQEYGTDLQLQIRERPTGMFYRAFKLPPNAQEDSAAVALKNGILEFKVKCCQPQAKKKITLG